ncbi:MAG TPA: efflux RND transporter permease subunit, partial [Steroidobacteraceae bacterium]
MSLLEFPIRRYPFTVVILLCLVALGWFSFHNAPREEDPYFKIPAAQITSVYPGADPKQLEQLVVKPIEDKLAELDDVYKIQTTISDGLAFTYIEFNA